MNKIKIEKHGFIYPMPVTILGTMVNQKPNFMAVGWVNRVNLKPPMIAVGLNKNHYSPEGIRQNNTFSVNFPSADMHEKTDYCGIVSGKKKDKSELFTLFYGEMDTAPMIEDCPLNLECRVYESLELPSHYLFVGEVIASYSEEKYLTDGKPDVEKMNPLTLTMPDNRYWRIGKYVAKAWSCGKNYIP